MTTAKDPNGEELDADTLDHPVMEGAEDHSDTEVDPRKGLTDPALIRDIEHGKKTANPYG